MQRTEAIRGLEIRIDVVTTQPEELPPMTFASAAWSLEGSLDDKIMAINHLLTGCPLYSYSDTQSPWSTVAPGTDWRWNFEAYTRWLQSAPTRSDQHRRVSQALTRYPDDSCDIRHSCHLYCQPKFSPTCPLVSSTYLRLLVLCIKFFLFLPLTLPVCLADCGINYLAECYNCCMEDGGESSWRRTRAENCWTGDALPPRSDTCTQFLVDGLFVVRGDGLGWDGWERRQRLRRAGQTRGFNSEQTRFSLELQQLEIDEDNATRMWSGAGFLKWILPGHYRIWREMRTCIQPPVS